MKIENPFKNTEDKLLFAKVLDKYTAAEKKRMQTNTDFLDPARCAMFMQTLTNRKSPNISFMPFGGYEDAERKIITFHTQEIEIEAIPITPLAIVYNEKFSTPPTHRDYLGAVLGLGLDRGKVGDIRIADKGAMLYVLEDVAYFIAEHLTQVGRVAIKTTVNGQLSGLETTGVIKRITVPSMRLDAVLGSAFNLSRGKASALIESEKVFVNWKLAKKTHTTTVGDTITVRGIGRITIDSQGGNTKKDRIVLEVVVNR